MTGRRCQVPGCNNFGRHNLPKDNNKRSVWLKAMKLEEKNIKTKFPRICSSHFEYDDFMYSYRDSKNASKAVRLKKHAEPSVFAWNPAPSTKEHLFVSIEKVITSQDSESDEDNSEPKYDLLQSTNSENTEADQQQSSERESLSSDAEDIDMVLPFNALRSQKNYSNLNLLPKFAPELQYLMTTPTDAFSQDPLSIEDYAERKNTFEGENKSTEVGIKVNSIEICNGESLTKSAEDVKVKQETEVEKNYTESDINVLNSIEISNGSLTKSAEDVEMKQEIKEEITMDTDIPINYC